MESAGVGPQGIGPSRSGLPGSDANSGTPIQPTSYTRSDAIVSFFLNNIDLRNFISQIAP